MGSINPQNLQRSLLIALKGGARSFALGYSVRCSLSLFSALSRGLYKKPSKLVKASFLHKDTIGFALFLAFYTGGFKLINNLLQLYRGKDKDDGVSAAVAGFISGLAILFFRSNEIAVYTLTRAIEAIYYMLAKKKILPSYKYGDSVAFSIATAIVAYCLFTEPYAIKPVYQRFLKKATGNLNIEHLRKTYRSETAPYL